MKFHLSKLCTQVQFEFVLCTFRESIFLSGPAGLKKVIHGARYFLNKENVNFTVTEFSAISQDTFEDDEISVKPVIVYPGMV